MTNERILTDYRLPDGRIVAVDDSAAKGAHEITFTLASGAIVPAFRVDSAPLTQGIGESAIEYGGRALIHIMQTGSYAVDERGLRAAADAALLGMAGRRAPDSLLATLTSIRGTIARLVHAIETDRATPTTVAATAPTPKPLNGGALVPRVPIAPILPPAGAAARRF